jgi:hypothetical protein
LSIFKYHYKLPGFRAPSDPAEFEDLIQHGKKKSYLKGELFVRISSHILEMYFGEKEENAAGIFD